jgi:hypothetical protein
MKFINLFLWVFLGVISNVFAQNAEIIGNQFDIILNGYKTGQIQWQFSTDKENWTNIKGENGIKLIQKADITGYYRAKVTGCEQEFISDTTFINTFPKISEKDGNIYLEWYLYPNSDEIDKHRITIEGSGMYFETTGSENYILIPHKVNYYYKKFNIETISKSNNILLKQSIVYGNEHPIYGIKIDLSKPGLNECDRIYSSTGLKSEIYIPGKTINPKNDFDKIYPYSNIKSCNITRDDSKEKQIVYEGDINFSRTKDTFIEIPKFYTTRYRENGFEYILLSEKKIPGFNIDASFIENGKEIEFIYIGAYESSINDEAIYTKSGATPAVNKTISEFRKLTLNKGIGFSLFDFRTLSTIQTLFLIEFANKNSQKVLGDGMVGIEQPYGNYVQNEVLKQNSFTVKRDIYDLLKKYWVGMNFCFNLQNANNIVVRKITNIINNFPEKGLITIYFDGDKTDVSLKDSYGAFAQNTGLTDFFTSSGRSEQKGIAYTETDICAVKYRGMENLWGNVWEMLDGIYLDNLTPRIGMNLNDYSDFSDKYKTIGAKCPLLDNNGNYFDTFGNISEMLLDEQAPFAYLPYKNNNPQCNNNQGYGDYFYSYAVGQYFPVFGGGWDHFYRAGLFCLRFWATPATKWYLYGSRMIYKPIE